MKNQPTNPKWGAFYKITGQYLSECQSYERQRKGEALLHIKITKALWQLNVTCNPGLDPRPEKGTLMGHLTGNI